MQTSYDETGENPRLRSASNTEAGSETRGFLICPIPFGPYQGIMQANPGVG